MPQHYAAGILPVTWHQGLALFLVGKDVRDGSYSDFGGKCERYDRHDPITTACREMYEESFGMCCGMKQMRARITPRTSIMLRSKTQSGYPYFMYVTQVPYMPHLRSSIAKLLAFLKTKNVQRMLVEKTDVQWVTLSMLKNMNKRSVFANTLDLHAQALEEIASAPAEAWRDICLKRAPHFEVI
jgi:hypothetical protein